MDFLPKGHHLYPPREIKYSCWIFSLVCIIVSGCSTIFTMLAGRKTFSPFAYWSAYIIQCMVLFFLVSRENNFSFLQWVSSSAHIQWLQLLGANSIVFLEQFTMQAYIITQIAFYCAIYVFYSKIFILHRASHFSHKTSIWDISCSGLTSKGLSLSKVSNQKSNTWGSCPV